MNLILVKSREMLPETIYPLSAVCSTEKPPSGTSPERLLVHAVSGYDCRITDIINNNSKDFIFMVNPNLQKITLQCVWVYIDKKYRYWAGL